MSTDYNLQLRCANRYHYKPADTGEISGFRVARTEPLTGVDTEPTPDLEPADGRSRFMLDVNQPNPFTGLIQITYSIPDAAEGSTVLLAVYDATGRLVRTLIDGAGASGLHMTVWDGTDDAGDPVGAGAYFYRLTAGDRRETKRMLLVK